MTYFSISGDAACNSLNSTLFKLKIKKLIKVMLNYLVELQLSG